METQLTIQYEVVDSVTSERFFTRERYEALAHYKAGDMVYERHRTITQPSEDTQTHVLIISRWNNTNFQEDYNENDTDR